MKIYSKYCLVEKFDFNFKLFLVEKIDYKDQNLLKNHIIFENVELEIIDKILHITGERYHINHLYRNEPNKKLYLSDMRKYNIPFPIKDVYTYENYRTFFDFLIGFKSLYIPNDTYYVYKKIKENYKLNKFILDEKILKKSFSEFVKELKN